MKIRELFNPIHRLFKIDFEKRITEDLELALYESKRRYICAVQEKQYWDSQLKFHTLRLNTLTELLSTQRGDAVVKKLDNLTGISANPASTAVSDYIRTGMPGH